MLLWRGQGRIHFNLMSVQQILYSVFDSGLACEEMYINGGCGNFTTVSLTPPRTRLSFH